MKSGTAISDERLVELAVAAAPYSLVMVDAHGLIVLVNDQAVKLFGYARDEMLGQPVEMLLPERFREAHPGKREEFFRFPIVRPMGAGRDLYGLRKDGTEVSLEVGLDPVRTPEGMFALATVIEITERQRVQELSRRLAAIVESSDDAIISNDLDGIIQSWNKGAESVFGYSAAEMVGRPMTFLFPPERLHEEEEILARLRRGDRVEHFETVHLHKNGRRIDVSATISPIRDSQGRVIGASKVVRDVTDRKRTEAELREQQLRVRAILDHTFQFIGMLSPEGILLDGNRAALQFGGVELKDVMGKWFWETPWWTHSPELQDRLRDGIARAAKGEFIRFEATHPGRDGSLRHIDFSLSPVADSTGKVVMLIPEGRDITERRRTERHGAVRNAVTRILAEEDSWREAIAQILQIVCDQLNWVMGDLFVVDPGEGVLRCLQVWQSPERPLAEFTELTRTCVFARDVGVPGRVWSSRCPAWIPDVCQDANFPRARAAAHEGVHAAMAFPILVDGEVSGVIEFFSTEVRQEEPDLLGLIGNIGNQIGQFIQRKRAEEAVRNAKEAAEEANVALQERVRLLELGTEIGEVLVKKSSLPNMLQGCAEALVRHLEAAFARIWTLAESGETLELQASAGLYTHLDGPHGRVPVGKYKIGLIAQERKPHLTNQVVGDPRVGDQEWAKREGMVAFAGHPLIVENALIGVVAMFARHPLTAATLAALSSVADNIAVGISRKRTEEALVRSELQAQAANRAKSEFLANMSHEIRTPMNGVLGLTRLVLHTELTPRQREYLDMAHRSAESLLDLLNDILDFSKIEAGKLSLDAIPFSVNEWVENVVKDMAIRAHAKNLELTCDLAADVPDALIGDPGRLRQVLLNLVSNAIKFTEKGEVDLTVRRVGGSGEEVELQFAVRDTGIGIPSDRLARIFEAFEQADTSITRTHGGTGLGLTISARLVAMMGGSLDVDTEIGKGSTFHFRARFPVSRQPVQRRSTRSLPELRGLRVLIVDDNATNRRILHDVLIHWNMRPRCVASGAEALQAMREAALEGAPYPLILLDAMMPEMDGFSVAEKLRGNRAYDGVTIMMLSSADEQADIARCRSIGVQSYLTKPVVSSVLFDVIVDLLDQFHGSAVNSAVSVNSPSPVGSLPSRAAMPRDVCLPGGGSLRILLAEDSLINQKVAVGMLQPSGHQVTVVNNGKEAVAAFEKQYFDVILMDVQMPEMDGLKAAAVIREVEREKGGHTPIIALTARAMKGDQESCLAAGMDGYVSKPIQPEELRKAIAACFPTAKGPDLPLQEFDDCEGVLDRGVLLTHMGGNVKLLIEILQLCPTEFSRLMEELEVAVAQRDAHRIQSASHTLKGTLGNLSATKAYDATRRLEEMGRKGELDLAGEAFRIVQEEVRRVSLAIARLQSDLGAP